MLSYAQALQAILGNLPQTPPAERLPLTAACRRVPSRAVTAPHDMPPFDQSMMDGYAVRCRDTRAAAPGQPARLALGPTLTAGEYLERPLPPGQAVPIMTGAPVPRGADAVIKMEDGDVEGGRLVVRRPLDRWVNVQRRGDEIRRRTVVLRRGECLTPQRIGTALALGLAEVDVARRPRVALVAPGDELLPPGAPMQPAMKWCSNLYALVLRAAGARLRGRQSGHRAGHPRQPDGRPAARAGMRPRGHSGRLGTRPARLCGASRGRRGGGSAVSRRRRQSGPRGHRRAPRADADRGPARLALGVLRWLRSLRAAGHPKAAGTAPDSPSPHGRRQDPGTRETRVDTLFSLPPAAGFRRMAGHASQ